VIIVSIVLTDITSQRRLHRFHHCRDQIQLQNTNLRTPIKVRE